MIYCIMLTIDRYELTKRVVEENTRRAGVPLRFIVVDNGSQDARIKAWIPTIAYSYIFNDSNEGVARMQNVAMLRAQQIAKKDDYRDVFFCLFGNDIIMPEGWGLRLIELHKRMSAYGNVGLLGIDCLGHAAQCKPHHNEPSALVTHNVFGTCLFGIEMLWRVGYLCNRFHPYGLEDSDWHWRIAESGCSSYYLAGATSEHVGADVGNGGDYRAMKDHSLSVNANAWDSQQQYYQYARSRGVPEYWFLRPNNSDVKLPYKAWLLGSWTAVDAPPGGV